MKSASFIPDRGDAIWLEFNPQAGHEQSGKRPAIVLSPASYNGKTSLAIVCPITRQSKGYPFECALPPNLPVTGVVLADHVRSLDWRARRAKFICKLGANVIEDIAAKLGALIGDEQ